MRRFPILDSHRASRHGRNDFFKRSISTVLLIILSDLRNILLTARIHYSFDNPYIWLLSTIFGVRSFHKFINRLTTETETLNEDIQKAEYYYKLLLHVFDASVFITILVYAVVPSYNLTPEANAALFLILTISLLSSMIVSYHAAGNLT